MHTALPDWFYSPKELNYQSMLKEKHIITKNPSDIFRYNVITYTVPDAAILVVCRDPFYVMTSKHRGKDYWVYGDRIGPSQPAPYLWYQKILDIEEIGAFIVRYEELVENPDLVQEKIGAKFGFEWKDKFSNFVNVPLPESYNYLDVVRPLVSRKLNKQDIKHLKREVKKNTIILQQRKKLGYEGTGLL